MISNGLSSSRPEGIERGPDYHTLKDQIFDKVRVNSLPPDGITLTDWELKRSTKMVSWSGSIETDFIFNLSQGSFIEVSRHLDFESIKWVYCKT